MPSCPTTLFSPASQFHSASKSAACALEAGRVAALVSPKAFRFSDFGLTRFFGFGQRINVLHEHHVVFGFLKRNTVLFPQILGMVDLQSTIIRSCLSSLPVFVFLNALSLIVLVLERRKGAENGLDISGSQGTLDSGERG